MRAIVNYFMIGALAVIPIVLIIQIVLFIEVLISRLFRFVYGYSDNYGYTLIFFSVSFLILVAIGYKIVKEGKFWLIAAFDWIIDRIPVLNSIYRVSKKIINMFSGNGANKMREVVFVEYPKDGIWVPAYVTNRKDGWYVLYVPTSPNPTNGFTIMVHADKIIKSDLNIEQASSFIISIGVDFDKISEIDKLP